MGITNTISELSNYFYQWHKNKYDEIHNATISTQNTIYETIFGQGGIQETLNTLVSNFNNLLNRYNTLTANSNSTIKNLETDISTNKRDIDILKNEKANKNDVAKKSWTHRQVIAYWTINGEYRESYIEYNEDIHMGKLYIYAIPKVPKAYKTNKDGYTDFLTVTVQNTPIITPSSNVFSFTYEGKHKIGFKTNGEIVCAFNKNLIKKSGPTVRGTLIFFSDYHD